MVETATLERLCAGNGTRSSNLLSSARQKKSLRALFLIYAGSTISASTTSGFVSALSGI